MKIVRADHQAECVGSLAFIVLRAWSFVMLVSWDSGAFGYVYSTAVLGVAWAYR